MADEKLVSQIMALPQEERIDLFLTLTEGLSVLELNSLVKAYQERFGVTAMAAVAAAPAAAGPAAAAEPVEEKTSFDVILTGYGDKKLNVIKAVRELVSGLGLAQAKELVEGVPKLVKDGVRKEEAEQMKAKLEEAGGTVELK